MTDSKQWQDSAVYSQCCICEDDIFGFGHNPEPMMDRAGGDNSCCTKCNDLVVAARLTMLTGIPQDDEPRLVFSRNMYHRLKHHYDRAIEDKLDQFDFTATMVTSTKAQTITQPVLTQYAGYLLEHMDRQLSDTTNNNN